MRMKLVFGLGLTAVAVAVVPAAAQGGRTFQMGPRLGYTKYAEKTGIESAAMLGLDGLFSITQNLGLGFRLDVARPQTDGTFFPTEMTFRDTTMLFAVKQPLTILQYHAKAEWSMGSTLGFFVNGSVGGYRITLDPQTARGHRNFSNLGFGVGGGIALAAGGGGKIRLEVTDFIWRDFNREDLNVTDPRFVPVLFPEVIPARAPFHGAPHNLHFSLAFSFAPGGAQ
jgi:hypothetical protein